MQKYMNIINYVAWRYYAIDVYVIESQVWTHAIGVLCSGASFDVSTQVQALLTL